MMKANPIYRMEDALMVIVLTPSIRRFLTQTDPAALKQAEDALLQSDLDSESKANLRSLRDAR